jgi:hypothetical protein
MSGAHEDEMRAPARAVSGGARIERRPRGDARGGSAPARPMDAAHRPVRPGPRPGGASRTGVRGPTVAGARLALRVEVRLVGGAEGRALAAAQGRAVAGLLARLVETEVGQWADHEGGRP